MKISYTVEDVKSQVRQWKKEGLTVGLVPTMGYLHEGHESLIKRAVAENDRVVVSVFLNPTQFAPNEDLASYPRDFEADTKLCEGAGAALVFHPEPSEMYAADACTFVDMTAVTKELCGKSRPIHFRGVCTVVNTYLSEEERKAGLVLSQAVMLGQKLVAEGEKSAAAVTGAMSELISAEPLAKIDYVSMVSWDSIEPVETIEGPVLVAMAVYIGKTRLIDNFIYEG